MAHSSLESNPRLAGRPSRTDSLKPCHQINKVSPKAPAESNVVEARPWGGGDTGGLPKSSRALKVRREGAPEKHPRSTRGAPEGLALATGLRRRRRRGSWAWGRPQPGPTNRGAHRGTAETR